MSYRRVVVAAAVAAVAAGIARAEPSEPAADANTTPRAVDPRVRSLLDRLPLAYEVNRGQAPEDYDFLVRCRGYHAFVSSDEAVFAFDGAALRMSLDCAARVEPETRGLELPGKANYLLGEDPEKWVTEIPLTRGAVYRDAAPGTTWTFGGRGRALEFEFVLDPGVDGPTLRLDGAVSAKVADDGSLRIEMPRGVARMSAPVAWQDLPDRRLPAVARWIATKDGAARIEVAARDSSRRVHVDPTVTYESYLGGNSSDAVMAAAMDASASAYVAGYTLSTNFPTTSGAFSTSLTAGVNGPRTDAFVVKMNASGSALAYATYIGGSNDDEAWAMQVDGSGYAYVVGRTYSTNFPTTPGAYRSGSNGGGGYLLSLNASGSSLRFSTCTQSSLTRSVALGTNGGVYVVEGAELARYSSLGTVRDFGTSVSFVNPGGGFSAVATDASGDVYAVGAIANQFVWPATTGAYRSTIGGSGDALVTRVDASGNVKWATYLGGSQYDDARLVGVNDVGQAYVIGTTGSSDFPVTSGAFASAKTGSTDWFITRFNDTGTSLRYSTYCAGIYLSSLRVHRYASWVCSGSVGFGSTVTASGGFQSQSGGGDDGFVMKFNRDNTLAWSSFVGGSAGESVEATGMAPDGSVVLAGTTNSTDLPTVSAYQGTSQGTPEGFLLVVPDNLPTSVPALAIGESALPGATITAAYTHGVIGSGGISPYTWAFVSGTLPPGVSLDGSGQLAGTPTLSGTYSFRLRIVDASDAAAEGVVSLTVNPLPSLPGAVLGTTIGVLCDRPVPVSGGTAPYTVELLTGTAPDGLSLGANGHLTGTASALGDAVLTIRARDRYGLEATGPLTIRVNPAPVVVASSPPDATTTRPYAFTFTTTGGTAPFTWSLVTGTLPAPLAASSGAVSGTALTPGPYSFTLRATDAVGATAERAFDIDINALPSITTAALRPMVIGRPFAQTLEVSDGTAPFTWEPGAGDFPGGVDIEAATDLVTGTPPQPGPGSALVRCTDRWGAIALRSLSLDAATLADVGTRKSSETLAFEFGGATQVTRALELTEGTSLSVTFTGGRTANGSPTLAITDSTGAAIDLAPYVKTTNRAIAVKRLIVPATGRYFVTASPASGFTGKCKLTIAVSARATWPGGATIDAGGPTKEYRFAVPPGAKVSIVAKAAKGSTALPRIVSVTAPDATDLLPGGKTVERGASAKFSSKEPLAGGDYLVTFSTRGGTEGAVVWTVKLDLPKRYEFEMPDVPAGD